MTTRPTTSLFDQASILPPDPDGAEVLHEREYRGRAIRLDGDRGPRLLLRGAVRGLSIARGFSHQVRERFGGPCGCTHTTALLLAMAPVAIQSIWSMQVVEDREAGRPWRHTGELTPEEHKQRWAASLNSCHVWDEAGEFAQHALAGGPIDVPIPLRRRFDALGIDTSTAFPGHAGR
jgi:Protein of unknown function (DUF2889)